MRSAGEVMLRWTMVMLVVTALSVTISAQQPAAPASASRPDQDEITAALARVKADPNLAAEQTIRMLQWKGSSTPTRTEPPSWLAWMRDLFRWIDQSARVLMWCVIAALTGLLAFYLARVVYRQSPSAHEDAFVIPTHVRDLDIRPEALPADVGAAARQLWDRGEHRLALALLYRGLLSRLAHAHRVPIRDASTEGDCLALAVSHVPNRLYEYAARLVHTWQRFVYGRLDVQAESVYQLCDEFGPVLDPGSGGDSPRLGGQR